MVTLFPGEGPMERPDWEIKSFGSSRNELNGSTTAVVNYTSATPGLEVVQRKKGFLASHLEGCRPAGRSVHLRLWEREAGEEELMAPGWNRLLGCTGFWRPGTD